MIKLCCGLLVLLCVSGVVLGGYPGVVDDEIWHHVLKVLSKEHGGSKIILGHPEPAHLVDAYTKIEYHEPYYGHHHYGGGYDHGHHYDDHHHHHHHGGHGHHAVYKSPPILSSYGPPHHHHHHPHGHLGHYKK